METIRKVEFGVGKKISCCIAYAPSMFNGGSVCRGSVAQCREWKRENDWQQIKINLTFWPKPESKHWYQTVQEAKFIQFVGLVSKSHKNDITVKLGGLLVRLLSWCRCNIHKNGSNCVNVDHSKWIFEICNFSSMKWVYESERLRAYSLRLIRSHIDAVVINSG